MFRQLTLAQEEALEKDLEKAHEKAREKFREEVLARVEKSKKRQSRHHTSTTKRNNVVHKATDRQLTKALRESMELVSGTGSYPVGPRDCNSLLQHIAEGSLQKLDPSRVLCALCGEVTSVAPTY